MVTLFFASAFRALIGPRTAVALGLAIVLMAITTGAYIYGAASMAPIVRQRTAERDAFRLALDAQTELARRSVEIARDQVARAAAVERENDELGTALNAQINTTPPVADCVTSDTISRLRRLK